MDAAGQLTVAAGKGAYGFSGTFSYDGGPAPLAPLKGVSGVAVGPMGNLFIADTGNHRIRRMDAETGILTTVAGSRKRVIKEYGDGGPTTDARLKRPLGVAVDRVGNVFIAH